MQNLILPKHFRRVRSFVCRNGRVTDAQEQAYTELFSKIGHTVSNGLFHADSVFGRNVPRFLEIGFGTGQSFLALANKYPQYDFIGVETHKPGIGAVCLGVKLQSLTNIRLYQADVIDVLSTCIPDESLDGVMIFFPDPWQKRRHHVRRLIKPEFVKLVLRKLKTGGELHLATDWADYAIAMKQVLTQESGLVALSKQIPSEARSPYRPIITKFEQRAIKDGRSIAEFQFAKLAFPR